MARPIFREAALERLASPEQLDQLMRVTSPTAWLALAALGGLVLAALLWSLVGTLPVEVSGSAVVIREGGIQTLWGEGQLERLHVTAGDRVTAGEPLATLADGELLSAPFDLHVLEVGVPEGSLLQAGVPLLTFERAGPDVATRAVMLLAPHDARQIRAGMPVRMKPLGGDGQRALDGKVTEVGTFPTTSEGVARLLGSTELGYLLGGGELGYLVHVQLLPDGGETASLPPSGTPGQATILVSQRRPIEYVLR